MRTTIVALVVVLGVWTSTGSQARAARESPDYEGSSDEYEKDSDYPPVKNESGSKFDMPPLSIRIDPFNWLIEGRLGLELEVGLWKFITFEMVPIFVVNNSPPIMNFAGEPDNLTQASNGLGPISGSSFGFGFWLSGRPLEGYVLRVFFTNYGYKYQTKDGSTPIDTVKFTERRLVGLIGSHSKWGIFTIATGVGLGVELNRKQRCYPGEDPQAPDDAVTSGCDDSDEQLIAVNNDASKLYNLNGWLHPVYLYGRISLGVAFDL
jgi:hypothetical protein